ncbi:serine hydrolase domain-containing protein [Dokdonia sp.]|uniref:serine hydrolase domain-containing protein n=1 Tax=Dokdonia sp. TaxID=2024995 RepID=UPI0032653B00
MKYLLPIVLIISTFSFQKSFSQTSNVEDPILKSIEKHGSSFIKDKDINSVSIGIYKDGEVYTGHYGEIDKGEGNTPNNETIYEIASVTKTMTGYLVARAVLEEKIKLDDAVIIYLEGDFSNLQYNDTPITIKHLLTHTSGLPKFLPLEMNNVFEKFDEHVPEEYIKLERSYNKKQFLADLKNISITEAPGTTYLYSNAGAELIGHVLETIYQKDIDQLLKESFLAENNMFNTAITLDETQKQKLVQGYWMNNETQSPNQLNTLWATGSGAKMTMTDMMQYAALQLNTKNPVVLESQRVLYERGKTFKIGYFWRVWNDKYGRSYNHHGGTSGMQNWLFIFPKYNVGISIMTNQSGPKTPNKLSKTVRKILKNIIEE